MIKCMRTMAAVAALTALGTGAAEAGKRYGCFRVTADELNIRERPYADSAVIGTAKKGDLLEKRKLWCTPRGFWCAIRDRGGLEGYADKSYMKKVSCP